MGRLFSEFYFYNLKTLSSFDPNKPTVYGTIWIVASTQINFTFKWEECNHQASTSNMKETEKA